MPVLVLVGFNSLFCHERHILASCIVSNCQTWDLMMTQTSSSILIIGQGLCRWILHFASCCFWRKTINCRVTFETTLSHLALNNITHDGWFMSAASLLLRIHHQRNADKDEKVRLCRAWPGPFSRPGLFWRDAFWAMLASAALSDSCNSHVSFVLVSFGKSQRFSVTPAPLKSPSPRQPQLHAFVLCLWAVILHSFLFSWHSFFFF